MSLDAVDASPAPPAAPPAVPRPWSRTFVRWARPIGIYAASRAVVLLAAGLLGLIRPGMTVVRSLQWWDGGWYLATAYGGYSRTVPVQKDSTHAFFPLYPLIIRATHVVLGLSYPAAAEWSALIIGAVATVGVWRLAAEILDEERAVLAVSLFVFFPASFVLSIVYAEGLMIAAAAACLLFLLRRQWLAAGLAGAVATAARPNAVLLIACCAWASAEAIFRRREWRSLAAPALAPIGILAFFGYLWMRTGNPTAWFYEERHGWGERLDGGFRSAHIAFLFVRRPFHDPTTLTIGLTMVFTAFALVMLRRIGPPVIIWIYTVGVLALSLSSVTLSLRPRFAFTAFPLIFGVAGTVPRRVASSVVGVAAASMVLLFLFYGLGPTVASAP